MENQHCAAIKLMLWIKYMVYLTFANNTEKVIKFHALWRLFEWIRFIIHKLQRKVFYFCGEYFLKRVLKLTLRAH